MALLQTVKPGIVRYAIVGFLVLLSNTGCQDRVATPSEDVSSVDDAMDTTAAADALDSSAAEEASALAGLTCEELSEAAQAYVLTHRSCSTDRDCKNWDMCATFDPRLPGQSCSLVPVSRGTDFAPIGSLKDEWRSRCCYSGPWPNDSLLDDCNDCGGCSDQAWDLICGEGICRWD